MSMFLEFGYLPSDIEGPPKDLREPFFKRCDWADTHTTSLTALGIKARASGDCVVLIDRATGEESYYGTDVVFRWWPYDRDALAQRFLTVDEVTLCD